MAENLDDPLWSARELCRTGATLVASAHDEGMAAEMEALFATLQAEAARKVSDLQGEARIRERFLTKGLWSRWTRGGMCALIWALENLPQDLWARSGALPAERVVMLGGTSKAMRGLLARLQPHVPVTVRVVHSVSMQSVADGLSRLQEWCNVVTLDARFPIDLNVSIGEADNPRDGIQAIVDGLNGHGCTAAVVRTACEALAKRAAESDHVKWTICQAGGIPAIVNGLKMHGGEASVVEYACATLCILARLDSNEGPIMRAGGIEAIIAGLREHPTNNLVQMHGCKALFNIGHYDKLYAAGAEPVVLHAVRAHGVHDVSQEVSKWGGKLLREMERAREREKEDEEMMLREDDVTQVHQYGIGDEGFRSLAVVLGQCTSLSELDLRANCIGEESVESLAGVMGQLTSLVTLRLSENHISTAGIARLRASWQGQQSGLEFESRD